MSANFIVVECTDNSTAIEMVKLMLEHGYVRLMLLDDLSKHPSLQHSSRKSPPRKTFEESKSKNHNALKDLLTGNKQPPPLKVQSDKESSDLLELFNLSTPEIFQTVKEEVSSPRSAVHPFQDSEDTTADSIEEESFQFDLGASTSQLDEILQAHCLAGAASPSENGPPSNKKMKISSDPEKDYHTCQLCSTKVKAPRGGRWNLQMHIMAIHSHKRPFKCPECTYTDYRKPGMRKHTMMNHGQDLEPVDICTDEKRTEWDNIMGQCFPEFAYRTGFLATATSQGAFSVATVSEKSENSPSD